MELTILGAVLGALVSVVFAALWRGYQLLLSRAPVRRMLGALANRNVSAGLYIRNMFSADGKYYSREPQFSHTNALAPISIRHWQAINHVVARSDMAAAVDVEAAIASAGRRTPLIYRDLERDWDNWSEPVVVVGGNYKSEWILDNALPRLVRLSDNKDAFVSVNDQQVFCCTDQCDIGLIYRGVHPRNDGPCLVVMGLGTLGTEAAGFFFRHHARLLGRYFGSAGFAILLKACAKDGREGGQVVWFGPQPRRAWLRAIRAPRASRRWHRLTGATRVAPEA